MTTTIITLLKCDFSIFLRNVNKCLQTCIILLYEVLLLYFILSLPNESLACLLADEISGVTAIPEEFPAYGKVRKIANGI